MKKCTFFSSVALLALMLIPQTIQADCEFTKDLFPGQSADRTALEVNATVKVGESGTGSTRNTIDPLSSTNTSVVYTYAERGGYNASVFFVGAGNADVTYTENVVRTCSSDHVIHYTVNKGTPTTNVPAETYNYTWTPGGAGEDGSSGGGPLSSLLPHIYIKTLRTPEGSIPEWSTIQAPGATYTSSDPSVATISASGVEIQGTGTTVLTAKLENDDNWEDATISYTLVVKRNVIMYFTPNTIIDTLGNVHNQPALTLDPVVSPIHWESTDTKTATVDVNTGEVTMLNNGGTAIRAIFDGNDEYVARTASYTLTVVRKDPQISFVKDYAYAEPNVNTVPLALNNPYSVPINVWQSSDPTVATIESDGSAIHPLQEGTIIIQAFVSGNPTYADAVASYTLYVEKIGVTVLGVEVNSNNADDVLGNGKVSFNKAQRTLYLDGWHVDVSTMDDDIKNGVIKNEKGHNLTVMLSANSSIVGAQRCIESSGPLYIRSISKKDTLILRANASESAIAVVGGALKMHEALFYTYGNLAAIQCNHMSVTKYGHVFGEALNETGEGIRCQSLEKGEANRGGIDILTYGVYWNTKHNAFWKGDEKTGKAAKLVEIGKVPLPISNDSVRDVSFKDESPEDNERIVFSENKDNQFNETSRELEITSTFTADSVDKSLNSITPGSAEWAEKMPGTLIMDVPTGEGTLDIACKTEAGYSLEVKVGNEDAQSVTQPNPDGSVEVDYNVSGQTRVIIYLRETGGSPSPRRVKADKKATPSATLKGITIKPKGVPTAVINTTADQFVIKRIVNGQLLIERDGKTYNVQGVQAQ